MGIFSRFFGSKPAGDDEGDKLVANPRIENPLSLQVLFARGLKFDAAGLTDALRKYDASLARARCDFEVDLGRNGTLLGLAGWDRHVVRLVGFNTPMPTEPVESCVAPSHYSDDLKDQARAHQGHVLLYYAGYEDSPYEQYVALAAVAGSLTRFGAIVVLNESARTSFPAEAIARQKRSDAMLNELRTMPLLLLYCGFVKYDVEGVDGVWMRTYGAHLLGLPDLAVLAAGHHEGQRYFDMFESIFSYLRTSEARIEAGHTSQVGENEFLRFREPAEDEYFLESDGELLVAELIGPDEINQ